MRNKKGTFLMYRLILACAILLTTTAHASSVQGSITCEKKINPTISQFPFSIVPRVISVSGNLKAITLAAVLSSTLGAPGAELVATYKHGKTKYSVSSALKAFLKQQGIPLSSLKPLKSHLKQEIATAKKKPDTYVSTLDAYLRLGLAEAYTVKIVQ